MKQVTRIWLPFAVCLAVLLAAMGWLSLTVLRLDRAQAETQQRMLLEENVRLALWRMDSALAPLVAQESARNYFAYRTFLPADYPPLPPMIRELRRGEAMSRSPVVTQAPSRIVVHFQFQPDGQLVLLRVPSGPDDRAAMTPTLSRGQIEQMEKTLQRVESLTDRKRLTAMLPEPTQRSVEPPVLGPFGPPAFVDSPRRSDAQTRSRGAAEYDQRSQAVMQNASAMVQNMIPPEDPRAASIDLSGALMIPLWIRGELLLARRVTVRGREYVQGCLLDWPALKAWLLDMTQDLVPGSDLQPAATKESEEGRLLAALPVSLVPGSQTPGPDGPSSAVRLLLVVAWGGAALAALAVGVLLWGVVRLAERRADFVSAVTHELRTPLTTFHIYTEMLADGMISDPDRQQQYLNTLRGEASRLTHLVENVLAYARLERGRTQGPAVRGPLGALVDSMLVRLSERARQAGMELVVEGDEAVRSATVQSHPSAVEQILFNLVDNACKYAAAAADKRIHLALRTRGRWAEIAIRDHGPGVGKAASRRLFRSFSKSARDAANSAPGVGLGLALSRRLARGMGGRLLRDRQTADGACFVLTLPR